MHTANPARARWREKAIPGSVMTFGLQSEAMSTYIRNRGWVATRPIEDVGSRGGRGGAVEPLDQVAPSTYSISK